MTSTPVEAAAAEDFDHISYFADATNEALPILITEGDASTPFTMKNMKPDGTYSEVSTCVGSEDHEFSGVMRQYLILKSKDAIPVFKMCTYTSSDTAQDLTMQTMTKNAELDDYKSVVPMASDATNIFFAVTTVNDAMSTVRYPLASFGNSDGQFGN